MVASLSGSSVLIQVSLMAFFAFICRDQSLVNWWHEFSKDTSFTPGPAVQSTGDQIRVLGTSITLHKTLRVADDGKKHSLPPVRSHLN